MVDDLAVSIDRRIIFRKMLMDRIATRIHSAGNFNDIAHFQITNLFFRYWGS